MSGEYLAQSKHQISANRLHKKVRLRIGFRRRTFFVATRRYNYNSRMSPSFWLHPAVLYR